MSSSKRVIDPFKMIDAGDLSDDITGISTNVRSMGTATIYVEWTGTDPVGNLNIQYVEKENINPTLETYKNIDFGGNNGVNIPISCNSGSHTIIFTSLNFIKIRPVFVSDSGIGSVTVTIVAKEI
jgi:hypothetical protein